MCLCPLHNDLSRKSSLNKQTSKMIERMPPKWSNVLLWNTIKQSLSRSPDQRKPTWIFKPQLAVWRTEVGDSACFQFYCNVSVRFGSVPHEFQINFRYLSKFRFDSVLIPSPNQLLPKGPSKTRHLSVSKLTSDSVLIRISRHLITRCIYKYVS